MANDIATADAGLALVVETASGKLRGARGDGIHSFKGVPYGASTAGGNRFMPPRPPQPWAGVRDALTYAGHAPQSPNRPKRRPELETILGPADATPEGEDCLTLNVWTPGLGNGGRRPVMVWLHGGGFAYGSGNRAVTDGANLARRGDVVVVSVNHRLNILGHLHLADLGGPEWAHSGNAGVLDLVAALQWVRDNIEQFGGDPGRVTIFGESGGGGKVSVLLAMPAARGLFHRAIVQSGAAVRVSTRERANALAEAVLKELGLGRGECEQLADRASRAAAGGDGAGLARGRPHRAGRFSTATISGRWSTAATCRSIPASPERRRLADDIPLLIGGTREESAFFLANDDAVWNGTLGEEDLRQRVAAVAGAETEALLAAYRVAMPQASPGDRLIAALTGSNFWIRTVLLAERYAARRRAPVYMYSLDWRSPAHGGRLKAHHAMDLPFVFDNPDVPDTTRGAAGARELAARISATWIAFARNGSPDHPAIPPWPAYTGEDRATMILDTECRVVHDPDREARLLWTRVVAPKD